MMKHYEVVAAVIEHDGKILCIQRNKGKFDYVSYKFEFPGGNYYACVCVQAGTAQVRYEGACGSKMAGSGRFKQLRLGSSGYADCRALAA